MNEPIDQTQLQYVPNLDNANELFIYDPFPLYSIETQYQRVLKTDLPKYVGINIFGLCFDKNGDLITQNSAKYDKYKYGFFNPHCSVNTIENIKNHFNKYKERYTEKKNNK